ncbi:unnamed protein product [Arabidopsis lyrata]|uniref:Predicted protein n=1 Tax=Arabidopsis lyrata subsp. lyrata TaxID=81972 RepID=D7KEF0_ARALL|nr:predicted protein [Arabidopsis lyrata subsp. lyrata]CAH8252516.1 unnamed protein product [Arabidopsis lyrata]
MSKAIWSDFLRRLRQTATIEGRIEWLRPGMRMMMHRMWRSGMREITANWRSKFNGWRVIDSAWIVIGKSICLAFVRYHDLFGVFDVLFRVI